MYEYHLQSVISKMLELETPELFIRQLIPWRYLISNSEYQQTALPHHLICQRQISHSPPLPQAQNLSSIKPASVSTEASARHF